MKNEAARTSLKGRALPLPGDDVDTDRIIPARFMKTISFDRLADSVFHDERFDERGNPKIRTGAGGPEVHPFDDPRFAGAKILIVGSNFGCGSSREHAPQALAKWGIQGLIGVSFSEIFSGNCTAMGVPAVRVSRQDARRLAEAVSASPGLELEMDLEAMHVRAPGILAPCAMPDGDRLLLLSGDWDTTGVLLKNLDGIRTTARKLPYVGSFET